MKIVLKWLRVKLLTKKTVNILQMRFNFLVVTFNSPIFGVPIFDATDENGHSSFVDKFFSKFFFVDVARYSLKLNEELNTDLIFHFHSFEML